MTTKHVPLETCKRGHPFDAANTRIRRNGKRVCRVCERYRKTIYRRRAGIPKRPSIYERFRQNVFRTEDCWLWTGARNNKGYGRFCVGGKAGYAHRWVWQEFKGRPIPPDLEIDHLCRNPACVNPSHMEPVTHQENMARGKFGRTTHCPQGHPYEGSNLYTYPTGKRSCRTCQRARQRARVPR